MLTKAYDDGMLSKAEWTTYCELGELRNSHAHFREPCDATSMMARTVEERSLSTELLAKDARRAIQTMARMVETPVRQAGGTWSHRKTAFDRTGPRLNDDRESWPS